MSLIRTHPVADLEYRRLERNEAFWGEYMQCYGNSLTVFFRNFLSMLVKLSKLVHGLGN